MTFEEILDHTIAMLQRRSHLTYRTLQRRFQLDDAALEDLKDELIYGQRLAADEDGRVLVWTGDTAAATAPAAAPTPVQAQAPLTYSPLHLTDKILAARPAPAGERKQVTVFFADIKDSTRLIEGLDPEAAQQLLDPAIRLMMEAVHRFEGTVNQVLGDGITALFGAPIAHEDHALAHLQATEFLHETRLFPEREFTFKHALTHEVAYGSLLLERRRTLHARIIEALERLVGDRLAEQVERLAHHALRGEVWDKALTYYRQAGEKAMAQSAYREAVEYFEQALGALSHLPEQRDTREQAIDLRLALRSALQPQPSSDFRRILTCLHEAEALAEALDDPRRLGQVSVLLSNYSYLMGTYDQAITSAQRALVLTMSNGEVVLRALANQYIGMAYQAQGDYQRAIDCFRRTVASFEGAQRYERFGLIVPPAVLSRAYLAWCHAELGRFAEGSVLGDEGLRIAEAMAHAVSLRYASWGLGLLSLRQGDLRRALPLLERAVGPSQGTYLTAAFSLMAAAMGAAYTLCGRADDAVPLLTQAMEQGIATERVPYRALCGLSLGEAQVLAGRLEEAQALAERALALARAHQERGHQAYALRSLGEIAARHDPPEIEPAATQYQQALALAEELGMRPLQAHCHRGLGMLYVTAGQAEQAHIELSTAINLYRDMDMTFWLPQTEAALAQVERRWWTMGSS